MHNLTIAENCDGNLLASVSDKNLLNDGECGENIIEQEMPSDKDQRKTVEIIPENMAEELIGMAKLLIVYSTIVI